MRSGRRSLSRPGPAQYPTSRTQTALKDDRRCPRSRGAPQPRFCCGRSTLLRGMTVILLLRRCVDQIGIRRDILRLELADGFEVSRVGDNCRELLDLFEFVQFHVRLVFLLEMIVCIALLFPRVSLPRRPWFQRNTLSLRLAGNRPSRSLGPNGPDSAISSRAACTCPHTFHNRTPRTRAFFR